MASHEIFHPCIYYDEAGNVIHRMTPLYITPVATPMPLPSTPMPLAPTPMPLPPGPPPPLPETSAGDDACGRCMGTGLHRAIFAPDAAIDVDGKDGSGVQCFADDNVIGIEHRSRLGGSIGSLASNRLSRPSFDLMEVSQFLPTRRPTPYPRTVSVGDEGVSGAMFVDQEDGEGSVGENEDDPEQPQTSCTAIMQAIAPQPAARNDMAIDVLAQSPAESTCRVRRNDYREDAGLRRLRIEDFEGIEGMHVDGLSSSWEIVYNGLSSFR